ncbi:unnamed protein product [Dibothriocephalus latus]|uniref:BACK domain-containing protein n=1 Tax=Dibothriocephalus latus TaxID=60516 RepID=A0A3P7PA27_DIBLA|nr:unnamed protein product [Dibothriocephalus latus]
MAYSDVQMFEDEFPLVRSCPKLHKLRTARELTDLTIQAIEETQVSACASTDCGLQDSFLTRGDDGNDFSTQMANGLPRVDLPSFLMILLSGRLEITPTNAMNMIMLAKQLSLPCVEDWAVTFLSARLQDDNLSECWHFATAANCAGLREGCLRHMKAFFEATVASGLFLQLPANVLLSMLRDGDLQVTNEEKVFDAIKRWVCPTGSVDESRIVHAPDMLREVRWNQTTHRFRRRLLESDDLIVSNASCMQRVGLADHWIRYCGSRNQEECPFNANHRPASLASCVLVFGESAANGLSTVYQYDVETSTCEEVSAMERLEDASFLAQGGELLLVIFGNASLG